MQRNYNIDVLKILLAFIIVLHHTPSPFHDSLQPITTCAVPIFFMISGYLMFGKVITYERLMNNALRIMKILLYSLLFYYTYYYIRKGTLYIPSIKDTLLFVFSNNEPLIGHLWYLSAYAYTLFIIAFLVKKNKTLYVKLLAITGLVLYLLFDIWHIYDNIPKYLTLVYIFRNFFFTAIPMFYIGTLFSHNPPPHTHIRVTPLNRLISCEWYVLFLMIIFIGICSLIEINVLHLNHIADIYFCTIPLSASLFVFFICHKIYNINVLASLGEKYSLFVYILHPVIIKGLIDFTGKDTYYAGVVAFLLTLVISIIFVKIRDYYIQNLYSSK